MRDQACVLDIGEGRLRLRHLPDSGTQRPHVDLKRVVRRTVVIDKFNTVRPRGCNHTYVLTSGACEVAMRLVRSRYILYDGLKRTCQ